MCIRGTSSSYSLTTIASTPWVSLDIRYHGLWDVNELYDLQADPEETTNLIASPKHQNLVRQLNARLFEVLQETGGDSMPLKPDRGPTFPMRRHNRSSQGKFPDSYYVN